MTGVSVLQKLGAVLWLRCHYCSRFRSPSEIQEIGTGGAKMCWHCREWHLAALRMLSGTPPPGCQNCGLTFAELDKRSQNGDTAMYVHPKDGIYQVLCRLCSDAYLRQRADLYGDTLFGWIRKLKGAH